MEVSREGVAYAGIAGLGVWFVLLCFDFLHQDGPEGEA